MKKAIFLISLLIGSIIGYSQTITTDSIFTGTSMNGSIITIKSGITLTFTKAVDITGCTFTIEPGATLTSNNALTLNGSTLFISGTLQATNTTIKSSTVTLAGCAFINIKNLTTNSSDQLSGSGLIVVANEYKNTSNQGLTFSSTIYINTSNTTNLGNAQPTNQTIPACSVTTPVVFSASPKVTAIYENYVTVEFKVANEDQIARYNVQFSRDGGKTWETVAVVIPNNTTLNKTYSINVNLYK